MCKGLCTGFSSVSDWRRIRIFDNPHAHAGPRGRKGLCYVPTNLVYRTGRRTEERAHIGRGWKGSGPRGVNLVPFLTCLPNLKGADFVPFCAGKETYH